jgi:hypothetical protein
MEQTDIPFVAVIGGFRGLDATEAAAAKDVGKQLGAELAKSNFGLVVYFSDDASLEPHVVTGYTGALKQDRPGAIRVRYAESQKGKVAFAEQQQPQFQKLFTPRLFPSQDWEAPFYRSLAEEDGVDAVLLVAGGASTLNAGQIAIGRRLPVLAVDKFGGSAAKIWNSLAQSSTGNDYPAWETTSPSDLVRQLKEKCDAVVKRRQEVRRLQQIYAALGAQRRQTRFAVGAFVALLVALIFAMLYTVSSAYPLIFFLGLVAAGATGALAGTVLWGPGANDAWASLLLGGVAGLVVGLTYVLPQLVGAPDMLTPTEGKGALVAHVQFIAAILVAITAGVGFDTVFSRLRERAREIPLGPVDPAPAGSTAKRR